MNLRVGAADRDHPAIGAERKDVEDGFGRLQQHRFPLQVPNDETAVVEAGSQAFPVGTEPDPGDGAPQRLGAKQAFIVLEAEDAHGAVRLSEGVELQGRMKVEGHGVYAGWEFAPSLRWLKVDRREGGNGFIAQREGGAHLAGGFDRVEGLLSPADLAVEPIGSRLDGSREPQPFCRLPRGLGRFLMAHRREDGGDGQPDHHQQNDKGGGVGAKQPPADPGPQGVQFRL